MSEIPKLPERLLHDNGKFNLYYLNEIYKTLAYKVSTQLSNELQEEIVITSGIWGGQYLIADGKKYVGEWKGGEYNGQGTLTYADGEQWKGEWQEDQRLNGLGTIKYFDGVEWKGEWKDGKRLNGQGTINHADGTRYVGDYKNGKRNGQGTYLYADGKKYVGEWKGVKQDST